MFLQYSLVILSNDTVLYLFNQRELDFYILRTKLVEKSTYFVHCLVWRENVLFVHGNCPLSGILRFPLQRSLKCIKSMLVSIGALAFVRCVEVSATERVC